MFKWVIGMFKWADEFFGLAEEPWHWQGYFLLTVCKVPIMLAVMLKGLL